MNELKFHPWMKYFPWKGIYEKNIEAPFVPPDEDNFNKKHCLGEEDVGYETSERYHKILQNKRVMRIFDDFDYSRYLNSAKEFVNPHQGNEFLDEFKPELEVKSIKLSKLKNKTLTLNHLKKG